MFRFLINRFEKKIQERRHKKYILALTEPIRKPFGYAEFAKILNENPGKIPLKFSKLYNKKLKEKYKSLIKSIKVIRKAQCQ